jgi:hypothetical protein
LSLSERVGGVVNAKEASSDATREEEGGRVISGGSLVAVTVRGMEEGADDVPSEFTISTVRESDPL